MKNLVKSIIYAIAPIKLLYMKYLEHKNKKYRQLYRQFAMDITNYCNARCIFCVNDWEQSHCNMSKKTVKKAIKILPLVEDGRFCFSCLYEPTLNPCFINFLEMIPIKFKQKVFFTTNLMKYIPDEIFHRLAKVSISYINISLETFDKELYYKMVATKNSFFYDNLNRMFEVFKSYPSAPEIKFITIILKDNYKELPSLALKAFNLYRPTSHTFRTPFFSFQANSNMFEIVKRLENQLLTKEIIDNVVNDLKTLNCSDMVFDTRWNIDDYTNYLANKEQVNMNYQQERLSSNCPIEHFTVRLYADGTGLLCGTNETFNLNKIRNPKRFFSSKLNDLCKSGSHLI